MKAFDYALEIAETKSADEYEESVALLQMALMDDAWAAAFGEDVRSVPLGEWGKALELAQTVRASL